MTLTTRLTSFFLAALLAVLAAFSGGLYVLARAHLMRQLEERGAATLDLLVAAAEVEEDGLEWDPKDRQLPQRGDDGLGPSWAVHDDTGRRLGASAEGDPAEWDGAAWRVLRRTLLYPDPAAVRSEPGRERYRELVFVAAQPVGPVHDALRTLACWLTVASAAAWAAAALGARWVCRRALAPVSRMAEAARAITSDDLGERLPVPAPADELRDLATAFNGLLARVQESYERQRRFAGEASHQLRTPLAAMLGQLEVALRREREPEEYRRALASASAQAGRLRRIVEMLLFLARADADARLPDLEPIALGGWLSAHLRESWGDHPRHGDLVADVAEGTVLAQPALLGQALDNLLDNALKHSPAGSPVRVRVGREGAEAVIEVEDQGDGIADDEVGRVFEPFFRSTESRRRGLSGVGLGLAVTARIVAGFGGRVGVESRPGQGTRFRIRLPLAG